MLLWAHASKGYCELVIAVHSTLKSPANYRFNCLLIIPPLLSLTLYYTLAVILYLFYLIHLLGLDLNDVTVLPPNQYRTQQPTACLVTSTLIPGSSIPQVPPNLVQKIESGVFIELGDLVPNHLHFEETVGSKSKQHPVTNISEWLQAFTVYVSVIAKCNPNVYLT